MRRLVYFITFIQIHLGSQAQGLRSELARLNSQLESVEVDSVRIKMLGQLAFGYQELAADSSLIYAHRMLKASEAMNYKEGEAFAKTLVANALILELSYDSAKRLVESIPIEEVESPMLKALINNYAGVAYLGLNQYVEAQEYFLEATKWSNDEDSLNTGLIINLNWAAAKERNKEIPESEKLYKDGLKKAIDSGNDIIISKYYNGYGILLYRTRNDREAINNLKKALRIKKEVIGLTPSSATTYGNLGTSYSRVKNYDSASRYLDTALKINLKFEDFRSVAANYNNIGRNFERKGELDSAKLNYLRSVELAKKYDLRTLKIAYTNLYYVSKDQGDYESSLSYFEEVYSVNDSLFNIQKQKQLSELETKYKVDKQNLEITNLSIQNELSKERLLNARSRIGMILLILAAVLISSLLYILLSRRIHSKNRKLNLQRIDELLQQQEIHSLQGVLAGQETERKRIAADLHDKLGAILSMVKLHFSAVEERIDVLKEENKEQYKKANELLDEAAVEVRNISHNLISGVLTKFGLVPALNDLKETIESTGKLKIQLVVNDMTERLSGEQELQVYRIIQELVGNILKHAGASEAVIQLNKTDGHFNLMVEDNGVGFDPESAKTKEGLGLKNLEARVNQLHGTLHFDSGKGAGTTVSIDIPLAHD